MDYHTKLEQFRLIELKDIFKTFQKEYGLLSFFKIYTLNKYDLICLLRNSNCFDECYFNHVIFTMGRIRIKLIPKPKKTLYKGQRIKQTFKKKFMNQVTIIFD